jgi:hypothetical protein
MSRMCVTALLAAALDTAEVAGVNVGIGKARTAAIR